MKPRLQDDDVSQYWDLVRRLERLENSIPRRSVVNVSGASTIDLGDVDGDHVTGLRLTIVGQATWSSTGAPLLVARPNGASSFSGSYFTHRAYYPHAAAVEDVSASGTIATIGGIPVVYCDWVAAGTNDLWAQGVFYTSRAPGGSSAMARAYQGLYANNDRTSDPERFMSARILSRWWDGATAVTSMQLAMTVGTFTGHITMETIP